MRVLIVDYENMQEGGIETYLSVLLEHHLSSGHRAIWLTSQRAVNQSRYKQVTDDPCLERVMVYKKGLRILQRGIGPVYPKLKLHAEDHVVMVSFDPISFVLSERIRNKANVASFHHFLVLPHFRGAAYYPERFFRLKVPHGLVFRIMQEVAHLLWNANCVRGFSEEHVKAYAETYGLAEAESRDKQIAAVTKEKDAPFSMEQVKCRATSRRDAFRIITCARFDFPHKGYLLGLVDAFEQINRECPWTTLEIIGYGSDEPRLLERIAMLPPDVQSNVHVRGRKTREELIEAYQRAHLFVGLAGALSLAAYCGLPCVNMRHYTYSCEGYGFLSECKEILNDSVGKDMTEVILSAATMDDESYICQALADRRRAIQRSRPVNLDYFFEENEWLPSHTFDFAWQIRMHILQLACSIAIRVLRRPFV